MLDLIDLLKGKGEVVGTEKKTMVSVFFYQTDECKNLVEEAYRFEGLDMPEVLLNDEDAIIKYVTKKNIEVAIVELNQSQDLTCDAENISALIPSSASVVIIGREDTISIIRTLKQFGFYYLFWPAPKEELIDFIKNVDKNRQYKEGVGQKRKAKRISVIGTKGGVGTTLITSEICCLLSNNKKSICILNDPNYLNSNLDILMKIKNFERREIQKSIPVTSLDLSFAKALLFKKDERLGILSLSTKELAQNEIYDYQQNVLALLSEEANFIFDDFSSSSITLFSESKTWLGSDCIVLIMSRNVSSVREVARFLMIVNKDEYLDKKRRLILVVNNVIPEKYATVTIKEIERFLQQPIQIEIPFFGKVAQELLKGKRMADMGNRSVTQSLEQLVSLILGEEFTRKKRLISTLHKWW